MLTTVASVRKRPGMYVGNCDGNGEGVINLVLEVVANSLDQHLAGRCKRTMISVAADGEIEIDDDGAGVQVPLDKLLTVASHTPTVDGHRPHAHLGPSGGGLGLFVVNALSERFMITSVVDGAETTVRCERGQIVDGPRQQATSRGNGTTVRFVPDATIFTTQHVPRGALTAVLDDLALLQPQWSLTWSFASDAVHTQGLAGRVAMSAGGSFADVATYTATYELAERPSGQDAAKITVTVALAWRSGYDADAPAAITSIVNWRRTIEHGDHVDGLFDGIAEFASPASCEAVARGLVAEVAVVLDDVHWGAPRKDLLVTPTVRAPVAMATREALQRWAVAQPELAKALRERAAHCLASNQHNAVLPAGVELHAAAREQAPVLENLLQLYAHDFSEYVDIATDDAGRFAYARLPLYWTEATRFPFLVKVDGLLAGFVLVSRGSLVSGDSQVWDMAEFFVMRRYRRRGIGAALAQEVWRRFPGRWEVRVHERTKPALQFWTAAISAFAGSSASVGFVDDDGAQRRLFAFDSPGEASR